MAEQIGHFSKEIIDLLGSTSIREGSPIYLGESNITHIKNRHPYEYDKYFNNIRDIINKPDYVGINPKNGSIGFVKEYRIDSEYIRVAVRCTGKGIFYILSLHLLSTFNVENYIQNGTLKCLTPKNNCV